MSALSQGAGSGADSAVIAASALALHDELGACLVPIIGLAGVNAISRRCVLLAQRQFPWLGPASALGPHEVTLPEVIKALEQQPAAVATEAAVALLDGFGLLLTTFIGAGLTTRLLCQAWPDLVPDDTAQERSR
ncbi:MAG: hypothetical protein GEU82_07070 [Luteitalea sp.]|nr:hypothetical protein [Luteitalea sp.]